MPSGRRATYSGSMQIARAQVLYGTGNVNDERVWRPWDRTQPYGGHAAPEFLVANPGVTMETADGYLIVRVEGSQETWVPLAHVLWVEPVTTESRPFVQGPKCVRCGGLLEDWNRGEYGTDLCMRRGCGKGL